MSIVNDYDPDLPLDHASTIPASWYTDRDLYDLELESVFSNTWQLAARRDQVEQPGQYVSTDVAGEPIVVVRGSDGVLRAFFNVCRHHAAAVMTEPQGKAAQLR
ncbi:MAG TPA: Rieske 2Fe-2S domain-containing protein, partial [Pyrinomonadaceae bacterium]|nr:Rieske 2Fe-2S domain-containing protein [Pyrinomonadaceae bacterium]